MVSIYEYDYIYVYSNGRKYLLHRVIFSIILGRELKYNEVIHHKDGNKHNNRLSNLELMTRDYHNRYHRRGLKEWK